MKFELSRRSTFEGRLIGLSWTWENWCLKLGAESLFIEDVKKDSHYEMVIQRQLKDGKTVAGHTTPTIFDMVEPTVHMVPLAPVLMLAMWIIKDLEPVATGNISSRWMEIMMRLTRQPICGTYVYPTINQIAELYKEGAP